MSLIAVKSDYISKANKAYANLAEYESTFEKEAYVLSYVKSTLLRNEKLEDFCINGVDVSVYEMSNGYQLYFDDYVMDVETYEKQIINFELRR